MNKIKSSVKKINNLKTKKIKIKISFINKKKIIQKNEKRN